MSKAIFLIIVLILAVVNLVYAYDDGDFQVWNTDAEEFEINNETKIALEEEFRWADSSAEFYCVRHKAKNSVLRFSRRGGFEYYAEKNTYC